MKYKPIYKMLRMAIFTALLGGSFASCSNTETDVDDASTEIKVPLTISAATIASSTEARKASYDANSFEKGDVIGLYILSSDLESYDTAENSYNVPATYDGSQWILSQDVYLSEDNALVYAYYPYNDSYGNVFPDARLDFSNILQISLMPVDNEQSDVLTAGKDPILVNSENSEASLTFSHVLTRITLSISLSSGVGDAYLSTVSLYQTSGLLNGTALLGFEGEVLDLYSSDDNFTDEWMTKTCNAYLSSKTSYNVDFLIHPDSSNKLTAVLIINDIDYSLDITSNAWQSGYQYTYLINGTTKETEEEQITFEVVSSSSIEGWTDKGTSDEIQLGGTSDEEDGDDEEESTNGVTYVNGYAAVDLGLSVKWATCNVGGESPEDYGNYYAWGETETKDTYTSSNSVTYGVEMDDISGNAEYDTATANWGDSWRMPTYDEMEELVDNCTWTLTTQNSVDGYLVAGNNGNSIFLPAAGYRNWSSLYTVGSDGYYWSSTPRSSNTNYAYDLYFYSSFKSVDYSRRYYGRSVRPVTDK